MPYGTPDTGLYATYRVNCHGVTSGVGEVLFIGIEANSTGGNETQRDALFQQLIDLLDGASFLTIDGGKGEKHQDTNTEVTPTP